MFTPDVVLRSGDRNPSVAKQFTVDGTPVVITGGSVAFRMALASGDGSTLAVDSAAVIVDGPTGQVRYDWQSADASLAPGFYLARFEATVGGKRLTAPNDGWLVVHVTAVGSVGWSYSGDPSARELDWVRFAAGDTDSANPRISDAEIEALLVEEGDKYAAAVLACEMIAAVFSAKSVASKSVGDLSISYQYSTQAQAFLDRATRLQIRANRRSGAAPVMASMTARVTSGQFDNPGIGGVGL